MNPGHLRPLGQTSGTLKAEPQKNKKFALTVRGQKHPKKTRQNEWLRRQKNRSDRPGSSGGESRATRNNIYKIAEIVVFLAHF